MAHIRGQQDQDLHYASGRHRSQPRASGYAPSNFEKRMRRHRALHNGSIPLPKAARRGQKGT